MSLTDDSISSDVAIKSSSDNLGGDFLLRWLEFELFGCLERLDRDLQDGDRDFFEVRLDWSVGTLLSYV